MVSNFIVNQQDLKLLEALFADSPPKTDNVFTMFKQTPDFSHKVGLIEQIGSTLTVRYLIPLAVCEHLAIRNAAQKKVRELLKIVRPEQWVGLDQQLRNGGYRFNSSLCDDWVNLNLEKAQKLIKESKYPQTLIGVFSSHWNGFIREATVNKMKSSPEQFFTQLVLRANDWVVKVKLLSYTTVFSCLDKVDATCLINHLGLIERLRQQSRHDHRELLLAIDNQLQQVDHQPLLLNMVKENDLYNARVAFRLLKKSSENVDVIIATGLMAKDALVRSQAIVYAGKTQSQSVLYQSLCTALNDSVPSNRKRAMYLMLERFASQSLEHLIHFLFDKSQNLREFARFYLKKAQITNFADHYRDSLKNTTNDQIRVSILGLSECGDSSDWPLIERCYESQSELMLLTTLQAAVTLAVPQAEQLMTLALSSRKCAVNIKAGKLQRQTRLLTVLSLYQIAQDSDSFQILLSCFMLIAHQDKWQGLAYCLEFANDDQNKQNETIDLIEVWVDKYQRPWYFQRPDASLVEQLKRGVHQLQSKGFDNTLVRRVSQLISLVI